jgi:hypothetical protein
MRIIAGRSDQKGRARTRRTRRFDVPSMAAARRFEVPRAGKPAAGR